MDELVYNYAHQDIKRTSTGRPDRTLKRTNSDMMNKPQKAKRGRHCKGFKEYNGGSAGQPTGQQPGDIKDTNQDMTGHQKDMRPVWTGQVAEILRTANRTDGVYSAKSIADECKVDDSTLRNRWFNIVNQPLADGDALKTEDGKFTELALELFLHLSECPLKPAEWVHQVLKPAINSMPETRSQKEIDANEYETALARTHEENDDLRKRVAAKKAALKTRRELNQKTELKLSDAELERIRLEEEERAIAEIEIREQMRQQVRKEMGLL
jgi:hypothetical protein